MALPRFLSAPLDALKNLASLPITRQAGVLVGLAASIAMCVGIVLWSQEPTYRPILTNIDLRDTSQVLDILSNAGIPFKLEDKSGAILIPANQISTARIKLANAGFPKSPANSFDTLDKNSGFGVSQFVESERYKRALESELTRTILSIHEIKNARVHLAIPKQSVFLHDQNKASASVLVDLSSNSKLSKNQVEAIQRLVAASVPNLDSKAVAIVDQHGRLLSESAQDDPMDQTKEQFEYTRNLEAVYTQHIEGILEPLLGKNNVIAKVTADVDFTHVESTQESFAPDGKALLSEHVLDESMSSSSAAQGIPGALSNQPPGNAQLNSPNNNANSPSNANNNAAKPGQTNANNGAPTTSPMRRQATRNFEVGKTISHTLTPFAKIHRLSVAVVVADGEIIDPATKKVTITPRTPAEITKITQLVQGAVGFNAQRGDRVEVVSNPFPAAQLQEPFLKIPFWQEIWFLDTIKLILGSLLLGGMLFGVLRPIIKSLLPKASALGAINAANQDVAALPFQGGTNPLLQDNLTNTFGQPQTSKLAAPETVETQLANLKDLAGNDPEKVAQLMKSWVGE